MAEGQLIIRNDILRYRYVLPYLSEATINLVTEFLEAQLPADPYMQRKSRLLSARQRTDYQRMEQIFHLPAPNAQ